MTSYEDSVELIALLKVQLADIESTLQASQLQLQLCQKRLADTASKFTEFSSKSAEQPPN